MEQQPPPPDPHERWQQADQERAAFPWFEEARGPAPPGEPASPGLPDRTAAAERSPRPTGDIAADTDGELVPRYEVIQRRAGQLVDGDRLVEPDFGELRVTWVADVGYDPARQTDLVQLYCTDDAGVTTLTRTVPADRRLSLRVPDLQDGFAIQRAVDRARYHRTTIDDRTARLIAAHLQRSAHSGLYRLAVTGEVHPTVWQELGPASGGRPQVRHWTAALRAYCDRRQDHGPLPGLEDRRW